MESRFGNYKVKLSFLYTDVVHVKAVSEEEAVRVALNFCHEEYDCFYDSDVELEEEHG